MVLPGGLGDGAEDLRRRGERGGRRQGRGLAAARDGGALAHGARHGAAADLPRNGGRGGQRSGWVGKVRDSGRCGRHQAIQPD